MKISDLRFAISDLPRRRAWPHQRAFTLIEMLVVIAIIGILAALVVGVLGRSSEAKVRSRVQAELNQLVGAIESYHKKHGFYPPGNERRLPGNVINTGTNQLFYELTGAQYDNGTLSFTDIMGDSITSGTIDTLLGTKGFVNSGANKANFLPNLKPSGHTLIPNSSVRVLQVPYKGPGGDFNTWHYNSSKPVHNPDSYDLWAVVDVGGKTFTIGNWKEH